MILQKLALGSINDVMAALNDIKTFPTQLPPSVAGCLNENDELWLLGQSKVYISTYLRIEARKAKRGGKYLLNF